MTDASQHITDVEAIREVAVRYCRGVDRLDAALMRSAYWPDATDDHGTFKGNAWQFVDYVMEAHQRWYSTMHSIFNHAITIDHDRSSARGEIYNITHLFRVDGSLASIDIWYGRYLDRYERRGEEWRIAERVCVHEATQVQTVGSPMSVDTNAFRSGSFDRPSHGRPLGP